MLKRIDHLIFVTAAIVVGIVIAAQLSGMSFLDQLSAKIPASVGNRVAPIPTLRVEKVTFSNQQNISHSEEEQAINSSVGNQNITPKFLVDEYQLQWKVSVEDGSLQPVMAQVYVPKGSMNQQFPVIVYGAGTTGLADRCAPSREDLRRGNMGNFRNYMISEASQGYIVVMPNYEGFDNPNRNQHYFNKDNEARTMLSASKAIVNAAKMINLPMKPSALFLGGYSQGGHAAFSAADYADTYLPDIKISGIFGHGPTTHISEYLVHNPNLAAYFIASYSDFYPAINPKVILTPEWIGYLARARQICVDEGFGNNSTTVSKTFTEPFLAALKNKTLATDFPAIEQVFTENNAGTSYVNIPTMIVQGKIDTVVTDQEQHRFVDELCARGVPVDLKEYARLSHFQTRQVSFKDTNAWIDAISNGQTVENSCHDR